MSWQLIVRDGSGQAIASLDDVISLQIVRVANAVGGFELHLPDATDLGLFHPDGLVEFWRSPPGGGSKARVGVGLIRYIEEMSSDDGVRTVIVKGADPNDILNRRIIAYAAGSTQAEKSDYADDMMKEIVTENLGGSATDTDRDISSILTVDADTSDGPSITKAFAHQSLLRVLQAISKVAYENGTRIYFGVDYTGSYTFAFRTWAGYPGTDRSYATGASPIYLSQEAGNLSSPRLIRDYRDEATVVYAGGRGEEDNRLIVEVEDTDRTARSALGRSEAWVDARNAETTAQVQAAAYERLGEGRPRLIFEGDVIETPTTVYLRDWEFGDKVTAVYNKDTYTGIIEAVEIRLDSRGREYVRGKLRVEDVI